MAITPLFPALITGFIANWWLEKRYALECDVLYEGECVLEYDGVCCQVKYLTLDITTMLGVLGGNISFGYTVMRYFVVSLLANRGNIKQEADLNKIVNY